MCVNVCECVFVCVCVWMCVCIHTHIYIYKKTQPFTGTLWFAVAVEVVVAALVLMYVEGYGTNEALPGKVLLRCC
jgi:hypothetical protein